MVPTGSLNARVPPRTPAFFNPAAEFSRDLSIIVYSSFVPRIGAGEKTFADAFSGVGSRGLRVAKEVQELDKVYMNDANPLAVEAAKESAKLNQIESRCHFSINEVCRFLMAGTEAGDRFSIIDLDPFGTPAKHLDCVLRSVQDGGLISVTATDTAVLSGIYPEVCRRRYYGSPLNCPYGNEISLRLVTSLTALTASRLDLGIRPVFCHAFQHYLRIYATVSVSNTAANLVLENIGCVNHCFACGYRSTAKDSCTERCPLCERRLAVGGPLWTGQMYDRELLAEMGKHSPDKRCSKVIDASMEEIDIPFYYMIDEVAKLLKSNPYSVASVVERLHSSGFRASRTALNPSAFKTDARIDDILRVLGK